MCDLTRVASTMRTTTGGMYKFRSYVEGHSIAFAAVAVGDREQYARRNGPPMWNVSAFRTVQILEARMVPQYVALCTWTESHRSE